MEIVRPIAQAWCKGNEGQLTPTKIVLLKDSSDGQPAQSPAICRRFQSGICWERDKPAPEGSCNPPPKGVATADTRWITNKIDNKEFGENTSRYQTIDGDIEINTETRQVRSPYLENSVRLSKNELTDFMTLMQNQGKVVTQDQLLEASETKIIDPREKTVYVSRRIGNLRKKLGQNGSDGLIETAIGDGYKIANPEIGATTTDGYHLLENAIACRTALGALTIVGRTVTMPHIPDGFFVTLTEKRVLIRLMNNIGTPVNNVDLLDKAEGEEIDEGDQRKALVAVQKIRKKLGPSETKLIKTVHEKGYYLVPPTDIFRRDRDRIAA